MKYLVTFACGEKKYVIDYYDNDLNGIGSSCVEIDRIAFYTERIETNEKHHPKRHGISCHNFARIIIKTLQI